MKLNPDLIHRTITGEHILIPVGETAQTFNGVFQRFVTADWENHNTKPTFFIALK